MKWNGKGLKEKERKAKEKAKQEPLSSTVVFFSLPPSGRLSIYTAYRFPYF
jgi:hypothetical protein